jgi:hypothetical protein
MSGLSALLQRADGWSERTRAWMITIVAACCVGIFASIWAVYASTHLNTRYVQAEPGAAATVQDITYRVHDIRQTDVIIDGDEQVPALANTTWVVVDLELMVPRKLEVIGCSLPLVAVGKRTWDSQTFYSRDAIPTWCDSEDVTPGRPYGFQLIYQVPLKYADQVYGVGVEDMTSPVPVTVLTPPAD